MNRIMRIVVGLALIGYGLYSGNYWFYLGIIPLITGIVNYCPMQKMMGGCKDGECATGSCSTSDIKEKTSCCSTPEEQIKEFQASNMNFSTNKKVVIKILGTGCANCIALKKVVDEAVLQLGEDVEVIKVEDLQEIMSYNVVSMPGFVINEKVISTGKLLNLDEVKKHIKEEQK